MPRESKSSSTIRRRKGKKLNLKIISKSEIIADQYDSNYEDPEFPAEQMTSGPITLQRLFKSEWTLFLGLVAFRSINALMIQTFYVPDEYWQSLEVSHNIVFRYGYLTWEWKEGIRGYSYPTMFAIIFKLLAIFKMDYRIFLIKIPRLVQAIFAALCDLYLYKFSQKISNQTIARWSLFCQLTSWFTFYCLTRTLTNSMETVFSIMALYYFPWPEKPKKAHWKYLTLVGIAIVIRPTASIMWGPLVIWHFYMYQSVILRILKTFAERVLVVLTLSSIIDRIFYGKWENVQFNFMKHNVFNNIGAFYGSHPWHWYISQGLPIILGSHVFFFVFGMKKFQDKVCVLIVIWTIFIFSLLDHKEFRFLLPILPLCMHISATFIEQLTENQWFCGNNDDDIHLSNSNKINFRTKLIIILLIVTNLPIALYTCLIHQRGTIDVMKFIGDSSKHFPTNNEILFLMPCHSTPYYSYIHMNISMKFLTCEPNLERIENYVDEADIFYDNPMKWIITNLPNSTVTKIVLFSSLERKVYPHLIELFYKKCGQFFHTHFPQDRIGKYVVVYCKQLKI